MSVISTLTAWYKRNKRDFPWRKTRDAYRIFVSEIMLQQTRVDHAIAFYKRWLTQFPSWKSLAQSSTADLLHAWAGLGYNRRALQLREAARYVVAHGVPKTIEEWKRLKGVGPYTAAAVHAITARTREIVIDTNVRRVAGRIFLGIPYPALTDDVRIGKAVDRVLPEDDRYWEFPQMLMDFGNAICTPRTPACATCPLRKQCKAAPKFLRGTAGEKPRTISTERIHVGKKFPDRIYRGRILAAVRMNQARTIRTLGAQIDPTFKNKTDDAWLNGMITRLVRDGMLERRGDRLSLPMR